MFWVYIKLIWLQVLIFLQIFLNLSSVNFINFSEYMKYWKYVYEAQSMFLLIKLSDGALSRTF
jgi:hypothetical protein